MELFNRRYLCFFAFLFVLSAFVGTFVPDVALLVCAIALVFILIGAVVLACFKEKPRFKLIASSVAIVLVILALVNSFVFVTLPKREAEGYIGEQRAVEMEIISVSEDTQNLSESG